MGGQVWWRTMGLGGKNDKSTRDQNGKIGGR